MINEYLLKEKKINIDKMMEFCEDGIVCSVKDLKDDIFHIVSYCSEGETYEDAIKLSKINEELKHRNPIVLLNEASDYFIKELFPLVNRFERLLRKVLYLYDALLGDKKNISRLEEKGLGEVFNMIMTDPVFDNKIKGFVNETRRFTKRQLIKEINTIQEENQWSKLFSRQDDEIIALEYQDFIDNRNAVMHARDVSYEDFKRIKERYEKGIDELNVLILKATTNPSDTIKNDLNSNIRYSDALEKMLDTYDRIQDNFSMLKPYIDSVYKMMIPVNDTMSKMQHSLENAGLMK